MSNHSDNDHENHGHHDDHADHSEHDNHHNHHNHGDHDTHSHADHHHHDIDTVNYAVVTVSSSRSLDEDTAGDALVDILESAGDEVVVRNLVPDDYDKVQKEVHTLVGRDDVDAVVTSGGTGVTPDDVTVEATAPLFEKTLPGFGELFRHLSLEEVGTKVVGTRAVAGISKGVPVFCLPGSENAVRLGAEEIIVHEASHLVGLAGRTENDEKEGEAGRGTGAESGPQNDSSEE